MPKENKTMRKRNSERNDSSSAHYERSKDNPNMQEIPDAPSYSDYGDLMAESFLGPEDTRELREAQAWNIVGNIPLIGPFIQAIEKNRYLEDYYKNTGKVPNYPVTGGGFDGGSTLVRALTGAAGSMVTKIASGTNDLYQFYAGEPDNFRQMMNGAYL